MKSLLELIKECVNHCRDGGRFDTDGWQIKPLTDEVVSVLGIKAANEARFLRDHIGQGNVSTQVVDPAHENAPWSVVAVII